MPRSQDRGSVCSFPEAVPKIHPTPQKHCGMTGGKFPSPSGPQCQPPNLRGSLQWSRGQPTQRLCHLSDEVRSLPGTMAFSFHCSLGLAWDVLEADRPMGSWQPPPIWGRGSFNLDTLEGSRERGAGFLSPELGTAPYL